MLSPETFRQIALAFPEAVELPHFDKASFRVRKRIFATLTEDEGRVSLKLSPADQGVFCGYDPAMIYPVPNKWGLQGWTFVELSRVSEELLRDALTTAYCTVAPARLAQVVRPDPDKRPRKKGKTRGMESTL